MCCSAATATAPWPRSAPLRRRCRPPAPCVRKACPAGRRRAGAAAARPALSCRPRGRPSSAHRHRERCAAARPRPRPAAAKHPSHRARATAVAPHRAEVKFQSRHEERGRHAQPEHRFQDAFEPHQVERVRTNDDPEHDLEHHDWNLDPIGICASRGARTAANSSQKTG